MSIMATGTSVVASDESDNFQRLVRLVVQGGKELLKEKFDSIHSPPTLPAVLQTNIVFLKKPTSMKGLLKKQADILYPSAGNYGTSNDFDITLISRLLREICSLTPPATGWHDLPVATDKTVEADLVRIKCHRNEICHHSTMKIEDNRFCRLWSEVSDTFLRIAKSIGMASESHWKQAIEDFEKLPLTSSDEHHVQELNLWYQYDMDVKKSIEGLKNDTKKIAQVLERVQEEIENDEKETAQAFGRVENTLSSVDANVSELKDAVIEALQGTNKEQAGSQATTNVSISLDVANCIPIPTCPSVSNEGSSSYQELMTKIGLQYISYFPDPHEFKSYLQEIGLIVTGQRIGSLVITVQCKTIQVLERLWTDYTSGYLNEVAEKCLITTKLLHELGFVDIKLKTYISEEEYKKCRRELSSKEHEDSLNFPVSHFGKDSERVELGTQHGELSTGLMSKSTVVAEYKHVDKSDEVRKEEEEKERMRLDNERREKERRERERIQRETEEAERELSQQLTAERKQKELEEREKQEKELRRKHKLDEKVAKQRSELFYYKFGEKIAIASFEGLDISDVTKDESFKIRVGVFGPTGSGKSAFVNTCERAVREKEKGLAPVQTLGTEGTVVLEDFLGGVLPISLVDTRGFFNYDRNEKGMFLDILYGRIKTGDKITCFPENSRDYDDTNDDETPFKDRLHSIIFVVKANDPRLTEGAFKDYFNPIREILRPKGIRPITVITHHDTLKSEGSELALKTASAATGSARDHTFFIANYCKEREETNVETELQVFEILHFALQTAERHIKIAKRRIKHKAEDSMRTAMESCSVGEPLTVHPGAAVSVEDFFSQLQNRHLWDPDRVTRVVQALEKEDIKTLPALKACWNIVRDGLDMSKAMMRKVEEELKSTVY